MSISYPLDGVQGCATHSNSLAIGVGHSTDVQCSSHGSCVSGICVCSVGWTGVSDMFNLDGLDCQVPRVFEQVMFSIAFLGWLYCLSQHVGVVTYQRELFRELKTTSKSAKLKHKQTIAFVCVSALASALLAAAALWKAIEEVSIGRTLGISLLYVCGTELTMFLASEFHITAFRSLFKALVGTSPEVLAALRRFALSFRATMAVTMTTRATCTLVGAIWDDETRHRMWVLLLVRNLASVFYFVGIASSTHNVVASTRRLLWEERVSIRAASSPLKSSDSSQQELPSKRLQRIITVLEAQSSATRKKSGVAIVLYAIFSIPQLYGFQGFAYAFVMILASTPDSHILRWYKRGGSAKQSAAVVAPGNTFPTSSVVM